MVTGGAPVGTITDEEIHARRLALTTWWELACRGDRGVQKTDERYRVVTERRDITPQQQRIYSSCADLAHWGLYRVGVRLPWLNRVEFRGWRVAVNVNRLFPEPVGPNPCAEFWTLPTPAPEAGDILVVGTLANTRLHVVCVIDELANGTLCTAEYGASGLQVGGLGGHLVSRPWNRLNWGSRIARVHLSLTTVLRTAAACGALVESESPEDAGKLWADR